MVELLALLGGLLLILVGILIRARTAKYVCPRCGRTTAPDVRACPFCGEPKRYDPPIVF
jgi:rubrerythrin